MNGCEDPRIDGGRGRKRAACEWDPGVVLTLLISRFRLSAVAVGPVGLWATPLGVVHKSTGLRARRIAACATCLARGKNRRIGEAGTAPTSTAKSRIDAVPHTVLSTHAGAIFQSLPIFGAGQPDVVVDKMRMLFFQIQDSLDVQLHGGRRR